MHFSNVILVQEDRTWSHYSNISENFSLCFHTNLSPANQILVSRQNPMQPVLVIFIVCYTWFICVFYLSKSIFWFSFHSTHEFVLNKLMFNFYALWCINGFHCEMLHICNHISSLGNALETIASSYLVEKTFIADMLFLSGLMLSSNEVLETTNLPYNLPKGVSGKRRHEN